MKRKSVIIIGGGIGGLFTGALLAKENYIVTILEKNIVIGGGLQCFKRNNELFETGMHILGGFKEGGSVYKICSYLGIMDKLSIRDTDSNAIDSITYYKTKETFNIPKGKENFISYFSNIFPDEKENIKNYVNKLYNLSEEVDFFYLRTGKDNFFHHSPEFFIAADKLIANYIKDEKLRDILAYMGSLYGGVENQTPAYIHALINVLYINGSSFFNGGSLQLAERLKEVIEAHDGAVLAEEEVNLVKIEDKKVVYVETKKGNTYFGDIFISSIYPTALTKIVSDHAFPRSYINRLESIQTSYSAFIVYIKLKDNSFKYINHPCYYLEDYGYTWKLFNYETDWPKGFMYLTPPKANQGEYASHITVNCIMDYKNVEQWSDTVVGKRGAEYKKWKKDHIEKVISKLELLYPNIKEVIDYTFAATPLTIRDYYGVKNGALYGVSKDCNNIMFSQIPIFTKVKNLFLTGQNVNLHGMCGVPLTAVQTAETIVGKDIIIDKINMKTK